MESERMTEYELLKELRDGLKKCKSKDEIDRWAQWAYHSAGSGIVIFETAPIPKKQNDYKDPHGFLVRSVKSYVDQRKAELDL